MDFERVGEKGLSVWPAVDWKGALEEEKDAPDSRCCVSAKRGAIKKIDDSPMKALLLKIEKAKASIRFMCSRTSSATGR